MNEELLLLMFGGTFSAMITFILNVKFNLGHVRASALVGVLAGGFVLVFPNLFSAYLTQNLPLVCFGASFIGMVAPKVLNNYFLLGISGVFFTLLYINASSFFQGFGGGLGAAACISLLMTLAIPFLFNKLKQKK